MPTVLPAFDGVVEGTNERAFRADDRRTIGPGQFGDQSANFLIRFSWSFQLAATIQQIDGNPGAMFRNCLAKARLGNGRLLRVIEVALILIVQEV